MEHFVATVYFHADVREAVLAARSGGPPLSFSHVAIRDRHVAYLNALSQAGTVVCAGPTPDYRSGIIVLAADSEDAARELLEADPYVAHGFFERYELVEFERHQ